MTGTDLGKNLENKGKYIAYERESCISGRDVIRKVAKQMGM